ncbi:MAG: type II toxin-antitoxin system HicB family antitoxin [Thermoproteota archaeon]|nr:MAG: type II toxin-antitoxin system HicB family antitoxin [Candidatus Korarchaeota archaeon]
MKKIVQVRIYKGEKYYVAECVDLPVVTQGRTMDEVVQNVREATSLHLEGEGNFKPFSLKVLKAS